MYLIYRIVAVEVLSGQSRGGLEDYMVIKRFQAGEATVYGEWDDVTDDQFIVIWGESGENCTVILLSGFDYGGGVTDWSDKVPVKEAEAIVDLDSTAYVIKEAMTHLVERSKL